MISTKGIKVIMVGAVFLCLATIAVSADETVDEILENETTDVDTSTEELLIATGPDETLDHNVTDSESVNEAEEPSGEEVILISPGPDESNNLIAPGPSSEASNEKTSSESSVLTFPPLIIGLFIVFLGILFIFEKRIQ